MERYLDRIDITGLEVFAHHGVYEEEQMLGQKFIVDASFWLDMSKAAEEDELSETVNYGSVARQITAVMQRENHQLLERAAEVTAQAVLDSDERIRRIRLKLSKPWAPIGLPLDAVSVEVDRAWHDVCLSVGSNIGEREDYLDQAAEQLAKHPKIRIREVSEWHETEPYGYTDQPRFLNGCITLQTTCSPAGLLRITQAIEQRAGRKREIRWGPRTLDIDILFYDDLVMGSEELVIPHPEIELRSFVLEPLCEIAPWYRHPVSGKTVRQLLDELNRRTKTK